MSKLAQDIAKIKAAIESPATPPNIKETMKKKLVELEAKLESQNTESSKKEEEKTPPKKPVSPERKNDEKDFDCNELIEKAKATLQKRKIAQQKANKKPEEKKQVDRVEKVVETVVSSIEKRQESGEKINKTEIQKLIAEYESAIEKLKKILSSL